MESSLLAKAKHALHAAAAKAESTIKEMKADLKADFSKPSGPAFSPFLHSADGKEDLAWNGKCEVKNRSIPEVHEVPKTMNRQSQKTEEYFEHEGSKVHMRAPLDANVNEVPKKMQEQEFWRRYFLAVRSIKEEILELDPHQFEVPSQICSLEVDSPKKDPSEEEAYKKAFTLAPMPPSTLLRHLAAAVEAGRSYRTMKELAHGHRILARDHPSNSGEWTGLASGGLAIMRKFSYMDGKPKNENYFNGNYSEFLQSLFEPGARHEEDVSMDSCNSARTRLPEEVHGAPPESFVVRLAEIIGTIKTGPKMAEFWLEVVKEFRRRWVVGQPISRMPVDHNPDLRYCLLHQQIQLINCCMARRTRRACTLASLQKGEPGNIEVVDVSKTRPNEGGAVASDDQRYVKQKNGDFLVRLGADHPAADLRMLETGEPIYSPVTQEGPILTEDLVQETEELVLRTGSVGAGCSHLLSDMQAFKAANPGCILEDFVRWYSPNDWTEDPYSDVLATSADKENLVNTKSSPRGCLSARMRCKGNLWQELWSSARPVPAVKQSPLFDEELAGESTLDALENLAPSYFFQQLFTSALSAGFELAERSLGAECEPLKNYLKEHAEYVIAICGRDMSASKLENLCKVYEAMETSVHVQPQQVQEARIHHHLYNTPEGPRSAPSKLTSEGQISEGEKPGERLGRRKSAPELFLRNIKGERIFSRLMEVKVNLFDKNYRQALAEEKKPPTSESPVTVA
ncbi:hypothetical protein R1sor_009649 [Riccia sorocarpa]|uniref:BSD domain-containing protein n=1 Tax=Riccia sorocarpa TaxID=122646 RepID=A0ABD3HVY7_9MARC